MAWLQKRTNTSDAVKYYSTSLSKTVLLVGLGNPGAEYDHTRHNIGFYCLDAFVAKMPEMDPWMNKKDMQCLLSSGRIGETRVLAIKPTTFMNLSGQAVQAVMNFYKLSPKQCVVLHDELDVNFGQIRLRTGGSDAGHNGIKSIADLLGDDAFGRIRIGIGPKKPAKMDSADFVLQKFAAPEQAQLPNLARETTAILTEFIYANQLPHETRSFLV